MATNTGTPVSAGEGVAIGAKVMGVDTELGNVFFLALGDALLKIETCK
jgi:hypothetical protein